MFCCQHLANLTLTSCRCRTCQSLGLVTCTGPLLEGLKSIHLSSGLLNLQFTWPFSLVEHLAGLVFAENTLKFSDLQTEHQASLVGAHGTCGLALAHLSSSSLCSPVLTLPRLHTACAALNFRSCYNVRQIAQPNPMLTYSSLCQSNHIY